MDILGKLILILKIFFFVIVNHDFLFTFVVFLDIKIYLKFIS